MKKLILSLLSPVLITLAVKAQYVDRKELPEAVSKSFVTAYASVSGDQWEKDGKKYIVTFKSDTVNHQVRFDTEGKVIYHQYTIPVADVPKDVVAGGGKTYPDLALAAADKIEDGDKVNYLLSYNNGDVPAKVVMSEKGTVIKLLDAEN